MAANFTYIYLDTEILRRANWPKESTELHNFLFLAQILEIRIFVPEGAEMERRRQWVDEMLADADKLRATLKRLGRWGIAPEGAGPASILNREDLIRRYSEIETALKRKWRIETIPATERQSRELFEMALKRKPPFKDTEKGVVGFQDAVIFLSVFDHLRSLPTARAVFLSADQMFQEPYLGELANADGVEIEFLPSLAEAIARLKTRLKDDPKRLWDLEVHAAQLALERDRAGLREFLVREFERRVDQFSVAGELLQLRDIQISDIKNVQTPPPQERSEGQPIRISFEMSFELRLHVVGLAEFLTKPVNARVIINPERHVGIEAKIEAEAGLKEDRYEPIKPISIISAAAYYAPSAVLEWEEN